jgi:hypothetical protein
MQYLDGQPERLSEMLDGHRAELPEGELADIGRI